jgi:hypothetical protein
VRAVSALASLVDRLAESMALICDITVAEVTALEAATVDAAVDTAAEVLAVMSATAALMLLANLLALSALAVTVVEEAWAVRDEVTVEMAPLFPALICDVAKDANDPTAADTSLSISPPLLAMLPMLA